MARRSVLDRFRPVGSPGPAGPAAVPSTDHPGPAEELIPLFAALDPDIRTADGRLDRAQAEAEGVRARARQEAAALLETSRQDAAAARAEASRQAVDDAAAADAELVAAAAARAEGLRHRGRARVGPAAQSLLDRMVDRLLDESHPSRARP